MRGSLVKSRKAERRHQAAGLVGGEEKKKTKWCWMDGRVSAGTYLRRCWWWCDKAVEVGREKKKKKKKETILGLLLYGCVVSLGKGITD